jgi:hypothetical protein
MNSVAHWKRMYSDQMYGNQKWLNISCGIPFNIGDLECYKHENNTEINKQMSFKKVIIMALT